MLVFLAADKTRFVDLDKAVRSYLAWQSIEKEKVPLDLTPFQASQVDKRLKDSDDAVNGRIPETYVWLLVPGQSRPEPGQPFPGVECIRLANAICTVPSACDAVVGWTNQPR
jgi:hypothetical protein